MMLKKIRLTLGVIFLIGVTLLFLDFTGSVHSWLGWMARVQFVPALLAVNAGVVVGLVAMTLIFGRIYCSVICPMGLFQDFVSRIAGRFKKNRFRYSGELRWLRYAFFVIFAVALVAGIGSLAALLEPYGAYGRIVNTLFAPLWQLGNNLLAYGAERMDSYAFYEVDVWVRSLGTLAVAGVTLVVIVVLAWRGGRTYCNAVCPVGTLLGYISKFSFYKVRIDADKCNSCTLCERNCKASCIDSKSKRIDYSRCVNCFNCLGKCRRDAMVYDSKKRMVKITSEQNPSNKEIDKGRRNFLTVAALLAGTGLAKAQEKKADGGLAFIEDKKVPERSTPIVPAGGKSLRNFRQHCVACQLCITACPNHVLRPSSDLKSFMQPEMSFERGYCRPECTKCADVCPAGAIKPIDKIEKSSTQIGHAVWIKRNCVVMSKGDKCGKCAKKCPTGAITMIDRRRGGQIPMINTEKCIGCGACEHLCPARPFAAIYVEGHQMHKSI